eukprot:sb/3464176/
MIIETLRVNPSLSVQLLTLQRTEMSGGSSRHYERGYLEPATRMIEETEPSKLIPWSSVCDGKFDCPHGDDECNACSSSEGLITNPVLSCATWLIGILSVIFNFSVIVNCSIYLHQNKGNETTTVVKVLVILIAVGDMCVGVYLLFIGIADVLIGHSYCQDRFNWLIGWKCTMLGIISTIGTQLALFSMTLLSVFRACVMTSHRPSGVILSKRAKGVLVGSVVYISAAAIVIAVIPMIGGFKDYFINGIFYNSTEYPIFVGSVSKQKHIDILKGYYKTKNTDDEKVLPWDQIKTMLGGMFHQSDVNETKKPDGDEPRGNDLGFYGNAGVCLFKYFVKRGDAQKEFTWAILGVNMTCFVTIVIAYGYINYNSRGGGRDVPRATNRRRFLRKMKRKITSIVLTDFICWVPFVTVCTLHFLEAVDATPFYDLFSIIFLPINSLINPLIYDTYITDFVVDGLQRVFQYRTERRVREHPMTVMSNNNTTANTLEH